MPPALALAFDDWFLVCWLCCIRRSANYFLQSSHAKSRPVVQTERQNCVCLRRGWQSISEGKDVFYYSCHSAVSSESTLFTCLQCAGHTSQGLNQDLRDGTVAGWVRGCLCGCRSGEWGPAATLSPAGSSSPSKRWHGISPHQPALLQTAPGTAGSQLTLGSAVHR